MNFVTPALALAGLAAVAVPILIHLLSRRRRRPVEWAAMRFLLEAFRRHRRRLRLEQLLLLAVRCLVLVLLGAALARPFLEQVGLLNVTGARTVLLVVDDGLASGVRGDDERTALQRHVDEAIEVVESLKPGDAVAVITAARPARALLVPPSTDHRAIIGLLRNLAPRQSATDLPAALSLARTAVDELEGDQAVLVYLMSGFRSGSAALDSPLTGAFAGIDDRVTLLASGPASDVVDNVQVVNVEPVRHVVLAGGDDDSGQVTVRLARTGGAMQRGVSRVTLAGEGLAAMPPKNVLWQEGQSEATVEFLVEMSATGAREQGITASIEDDRLAADNARHAVLELRDRVRVLMIDRRSFGFVPTVDQLTAGQWIRRALEPYEAGPMEMVEVEPAALTRPDARSTDVIIAPRPDLLTDDGWRVLDEFVRGGGLLMLCPPGDSNIHQWAERLGTELGLPWQIALETRLYDEGMLMAPEQPASELLRLISSELNELCASVVCTRVLPVDPQSAARPLLLLADGSPLAVAGSPVGGETNAARGGLVVYFASAPQLDWTSLPSQPLMVPLFHETIRQGMSMLRAGQRFTVGEQPVVAAGPAAQDLVDPEGQQIALDADRRSGQALAHAGLYEVVDGAAQRVATLAVNIDVAAGRLETQSPAAVGQWLSSSGPWQFLDAADPTAPLRSADTHAPLAGLLLAALLALLVVETVLARWFSYATPSASAPLAAGWRVAPVSAGGRLLGGGGS